MVHGSLFSGIGGFDLAAEWMGWENAFHCEWNPFGQKVLKYYWPNATSYADITKTDFSIWRGRIDILTGGFPCQPYSTAGLRKGKDDERHLWPHMLRAIREIKPRWVVGENVLGLVGWNGGMVFEEVQADLEAEGYEVQPYILPAASVNAPHRRDRVWFVGYAKHNGLHAAEVGRDDQESSIATRENKEWESHGANRLQSGIATNPTDIGQQQQSCWCRTGNERGVLQSRRINEGGKSLRGSEAFADATIEGLEVSGQARVGKLPEKVGEGMDNRPEQFSANASDTNNEGLERFSVSSRNDEKEWKETRRCFEQHTCNDGRALPTETWQNFPTQSPVCVGNDGISSRLDGITFSKWRNESIKAGGNAIVPQVAFEIFKAIQEYETSLSKESVY